MTCDVLIVGGGTGGVAAALALEGKGLKVILTEETDWVGGQLTSQMVPPDEHPWIESFGRTARYARQRSLWRLEFLNRNKGRLTASSLSVRNINTGGGWVSRICCEPKDILVCLERSLAQSSPEKLTILLEHRATSVGIHDDSIAEVSVQCLRTGNVQVIQPRFVLDATELGDLLSLGEIEHVLGAESQSQTQEPHAIQGSSDPRNIQSFTWCGALAFDPDNDRRIAKPSDYDFWKSYEPRFWTGQLLDLTFPNVRTGSPMLLPLFSEQQNDLTLFGYRQIVDSSKFISPTHNATIMNWPQNDYMLGDVLHGDVQHLDRAKQLTKSVLYWLQSELGYEGLYFSTEVSGTEDGLAKMPYHRESRRIVAYHTVREQDVSPECHPTHRIAPPMPMSVGVGAYRIDLHPSTNGADTIDISSLPFQIPLGSLVPIRIKNLLPACKNIGTTHITNGCYRLHPVEWNIGESAGLLASFCIQSRVPPVAVLEDTNLFEDFETRLISEGVEIRWPEIGAL